MSTDAPTLSVVVVTYNSAAEITHSLPAIAAELRDGDQLIVVDNGSDDGTADRARELAPAATVFDWGENLGFGAAVNAGAVAATGELLLILNPDATVRPGFRDAIELPLTEGRGWDAWQALVTLPGGEVVNSWGNVTHYTGIAWAGGAGRPLSDAPAEPVEVGFPSGAALVVTTAAWEALGGFSEEYFLYHEDTDLGLRAWLAGYRCGIEPRARAEHDYEFAKGSHKWYFLERNRWATIWRTYPARLLVLLFPALLATQLALLVVAARGGWLREKLRADRDAARALPRLLRERAAIKETRAIGGREFASHLVAELDSGFLGAAGRSRPLNALLRAYWTAVRPLC